MGLYLKDNLRYAITTILVGMVIYILCNCISLVGVPELIVKMILCAIIAPVLFAIIGLTNDKDKDSIRWFIRCVMKG
jgi:type IV secretory pathway VirB3-like protein